VNQFKGSITRSSDIGIVTLPEASQAHHARLAGQV
jgi:hypothetical protein